MTGATPDPVPTSAEQLARSLLAAAEEDAALLRRPFAAPTRLPATLRPPPPLATLRALTKPERAAPDRSPYLEGLVSIAVCAAREAEHAVEDARRASSASRKAKLLYLAVGLAGIVIGIAGAAEHEFAGRTLADQRAAVAPADSAEPAVVAPASVVMTADRGSELSVSSAPDAAARPAPHAVTATPPGAVAVPERPVVAIAPPAPAGRSNVAQPELTGSVWPAYNTEPVHRTYHPPIYRPPQPLVRPPVVFIRVMASIRRDAQVLFR